MGPAGVIYGGGPQSLYSGSPKAKVQDRRAEFKYRRNPGFPNL